MIVLKFALEKEINKPQSIVMPADAVVLSVGVQNDCDIRIWVATDSKDSAIRTRTFVCLFTGNEYVGNFPLKFIGRVTLRGLLEWFVFEELQDTRPVVRTVQNLLSQVFGGTLEDFKG